MSDRIDDAAGLPDETLVRPTGRFDQRRRDPMKETHDAFVAALARFFKAIERYGERDRRTVRAGGAMMSARRTFLDTWGAGDAD